VILKLFLIDTRPDKSYREWLCSFCGDNISNYSWSSFDSKEDGVAVPRWQPAYCTLRKLLDRIAQDFFPGRKVSLDTIMSQLNDEIRLPLMFHEFDELSTVMSTTWIDVKKQKPESASFQAMNKNQ